MVLGKGAGFPVLVVSFTLLCAFGIWRALQGKEPYDFS